MAKRNPKRRPARQDRFADLPPSIGFDPAEWSTIDGDARRELARRVAALPIAAALMAVDLRRSRGWTYSAAAPTAALAHAAAEIFIHTYRKILPPRSPADTYYLSYANDFCRIAGERAALDGDDTALHVLNLPNRNRPVPEHARPYAEEQVDRALAKIAELERGG